MTFSGTEMKELGRSTQINIHNTRLLIRALKYVSEILRTEEAFTVEEHKHTHTHTHTRAREVDNLKIPKNSIFKPLQIKFRRIQIIFRRTNKEGLDSCLSGVFLL